MRRSQPVSRHHYYRWAYIWNHRGDQAPQILDLSAAWISVVSCREKILLAFAGQGKVSDSISRRVDERKEFCLSRK